MTGHLINRFMECVHDGIRDGVFEHLRRTPAVARTDPATIAAWAEWVPPDEWARLRSGKGE